jgi:NAD+ kinase
VRLSLVLHPYREEATTIARSLTASALSGGFEVDVAPADAGRVPDAEVRSDGSPAPDVVIGVGGDGTVLEAVRRGIAADAPVLGVNAGQVGFLTEVEPGRTEEALEAISSGRYLISERMTLEARLPGTGPVMGINDAVIEKTVTQHVIRVGVWVGEERLVGYRSDGIVVATPTGSTAYNFSAGGPLLDPELNALMVTPVAPHTLFGRPIVFGPEVRLRFEIEADRSARVNVDGRSVGEIDPGQAVEILRSDMRARFLRLAPRNFARSVREKFHLHDA